jgi:hypothetical protein
MAELQIKGDKVYYVGGQIPTKDLAELIINKFAPANYKKKLLRALEKDISTSPETREILEANERWYREWRSYVRIGTFRDPSEADSVLEWMKPTVLDEIYRQIFKNTSRDKQIAVKRTPKSGLDVVIAQQLIPYSLPDNYKWINKIPTIIGLNGDYPLNFTTEAKKRDGNICISEVNDILFKTSFDTSGWRIYPAFLGASGSDEIFALHLFSQAFELAGIAQQNLFELAESSVIINRKPDCILVYGSTAEMNRIHDLVYYDDKEDDIIVTTVPGIAKYSYNGYLKKPAVQNANIWALKKKYWPCHSLVITFYIEECEPFTLLFIGDTMTGKTETAVAAFKLAKELGIKVRIETSVDDMCALNRQLQVLSWERVGGFVKTDGIVRGALESDKMIKLNDDHDGNPRANIPYIKYDPSNPPIPNMVAIGDNYSVTENPIKFFSSAEEAFLHFWHAKRKIGGTVQGLDPTKLHESPCGNPFIGGRTEEFYQRTLEFLHMIDQANIPLCKMESQLMVDPIEGPKILGRAILNYILEINGKPKIS